MLQQPRSTESTAGGYGESFYQRFPRRLVIALVLAGLLCIYLPIIIPMLSPMPMLALLVRLIFVATIAMFVYNAMAALMVLYQPALRLDSSGLTFRGLRVSWAWVRDIGPYRTMEGAGIGLTLDNAAFSHDDCSRDGLRSLTPRLFRPVVRRHGVLPLPPMRGIANDNLMALMARMRKQYSG